MGLRILRETMQSQLSWIVKKDEFRRFSVENVVGKDSESNQKSLQRWHFGVGARWPRTGARAASRRNLHWVS